MGAGPRKRRNVRPRSGGSSWLQTFFAGGSWRADLASRFNSATARGGRRLKIARCVTALAFAFALAAPLLIVRSAHAVEAVNVRIDAPAIDLTDATERQKTDADRIQVSTAPGADGIVRRIEVRAREGGTNWA